jgi:ubiquinone/menaquinone biosynthesis methyltransferase
MIHAGPPRLGSAFDSPRSRQAYVRSLFARIAHRYDLITVLLSGGMDRRWKRRVVSLAAPRQGDRALDLACGTGDIALALAAKGAGVTGLDVTHAMLRLAKVKGGRVAYVTGDMMTLPFGPAGLDIVTTGYGIRNVPVLERALSEIHRVLRPGGVFVSLDFNRPGNRMVRTIYLVYLTAVGAALGYVLHRDPDTYRYIPASIRHYPGASRVCGLLREAGFEACEYVSVLGGLMAIHVARKEG